MFLRAATLLSLPVALAVLTGFTYDRPLAHSPTLLPEVQKQLDDARQCSLNGTPDMAVAHANLILVNDDVAYAVTYEGVPVELRGRCKKAIEGALGAWQKALENTVSFHVIPDQDRADMVIRFKPSVRMGAEEVAGYVNWKRTLRADEPKVQTVSFKSVLQIRTQNLDGEPMRLDCVRHEVAHEVGHVLGLDDSPETGDLMGPLDVDHPVGGPKRYESELVRKLRDEAHQLRSDALARAQNVSH